MFMNILEKNVIEIFLVRVKGDLSQTSFVFRAESFLAVCVPDMVPMTTADGWFGLTERAEKAVGSRSTMTMTRQD